jgi:glutamate synthase domain-containing protein 3
MGSQKPKSNEPAKEQKKRSKDTTRDLNVTLAKDIKSKKAATIKASGQNCLAVGIDEKAKVTVEGRVGDLFGALNNGATIVLNGTAGRFVGDTMNSGKVTVNGDCGEGAGMYMYGGHLIINGDAGDNIAQIAKGGAVVVNGNLGDFAGLYLTGGCIIVTGNSGDMTGDWMIKGAIFVGGNIGGMGNNTKVENLTAEDKKFLENIFSENKIKAQISKMKKIVPKDLRPFYKR